MKLEGQTWEVLVKDKRLCESCLTKRYVSKWKHLVKSGRISITIKPIKDKFEKVKLGYFSQYKDNVECDKCHKVKKIKWVSPVEIREQKYDWNSEKIEIYGIVRFYCDECAPGGVLLEPITCEDCGKQANWLFMLIDNRPKEALLDEQKETNR